MHINQTTYMKDPETFGELEFLELGSRDLFKKSEMGGWLEYEPETYTLVEFKRDLKAIGNVTRFETYMSSKSVLQVTRGSVLIDGIERFFYLEYASYGLYKSMVDGVISAIKYTKEV